MERGPHRTCLFVSGCRRHRHEPAFIFPFTFVVDPAGVGILLMGPWMTVVWTSLTAAIGIGLVAVVTAMQRGFLPRLRVPPSGG